MESPVVVDKPPEYNSNERGFPFDEEEGTGAWSELASRHPDIAARLRQRPATWARKRRPSSQDGVDDSGDNFGGFDRFPFDDIPPEFREHFPSHWNRRFGSHDEQHQPPSPQQQTAATQTEQAAGPLQEDQQAHIPQYGLRNTVDLGQKSAADPSIAETDDRSQRSMSAPPDNRATNPNINKMSGQNNQEQPHPPQQEQSNVRHIPIFVEGRDEPVINKSVNHGNTQYAETKPTYVPPQQPHVEREQYYSDDVPVGFPFSKSFDRPFFRQGPQPFTKQKMYPQSAFARGGSPQRSQSPKPSYQEQHVPRAETPTKPQQKQPPPQSKQTPPQSKQTPPQQKQPPRQQSPPAPPQTHAPPQNQAPPQEPPHHQPPTSNDPISQILGIQTDVLNLMTEVENFAGTKRDKQYLFLDEMLTRNLIKLDNIETDGKENIRQARKEAIKCIQKCIAVLEAKADKKSVTSPQPSQDVEMQSPETADKKEVVQNGDVEMKEATKEEPKVEEKQEQPASEVQQEVKSDEIQKENQPEEIPVVDTSEVVQPPVADTRPTEDNASTEKQLKPDEKKTEKKSPKKIVKKRDKSKDKKEPAKDSAKETLDKQEKGQDEKGTDDKKEDVNENIVNKIESNDVNKTDDKNETMQIDAKGDKPDSQTMEVDGAASQ